MIYTTWSFGLCGFAPISAVRQAVFCEEQGYDPADEFDAADAQAWHVLVHQDGAAVGTGRLFLKNGIYTIGRVCVRQEHRGQHLGELVMRQLLRRAVAAGAAEVVLRSQDHATGFYQRFGFVTTSRPTRHAYERSDHVDMCAKMEDILQVLDAPCRTTP